MKLKLAPFVAAAGALAGTAIAANAQGSFYLKNGDRVVFYGDSITEQHLYTNWVEDYVVTRFPNLKVDFVNAGVGGDRVTGGWAGDINTRLKRDLIPFKPTIVTCMLAMNDASYRAYDPAIFHTYAKGYKYILDTVKASLPDVRWTLIEPSPYDDVTRAPGFPGGYNAVLLKYAAYVKKLAASTGSLVTDFNHPMTEMLGKANVADPSLASKLIPDRVHPSPAGHLIMAESLLRTWNAPATVASATIDGSTGKVTAELNTKISGITTTNGVISWAETDKSLPFPLDLKDAETKLVLASSNFVQKIDEEPLTVTGLTAAHYVLAIDGTTVGTFTPDELSAGVNLALLDTPMLKQALAVNQLTTDHSNVHMTMWRNVEMPYAYDQGPALSKAIQALNALDFQLQTRRRMIAQPHAHTFTLTPAA